ncbi:MULTISPECIES: hypothetical protein [unclassified Proteiniphilum]|uniref:hypothetical protein n=1 Tax=unclassified Proteiniphilum TaxID=2622718 RepID=UPI0032E3D042
MGMIEITQPNNPNTLIQKYRLTEKQKRIKNKSTSFQQVIRVRNPPAINVKK